MSSFLDARGLCFMSWIVELIHFALSYCLTPQFCLFSKEAKLRCRAITQGPKGRGDTTHLFYVLKRISRNGFTDDFQWRIVSLTLMYDIEVQFFSNIFGPNPLYGEDEIFFEISPKTGDRRVEQRHQKSSDLTFHPKKIF